MFIKQKVLSIVACTLFACCLFMAFPVGGNVSYSQAYRVHKVHLEQQPTTTKKRQTKTTKLTYKTTQFKKKRFKKRFYKKKNPTRFDLLLAGFGLFLFQISSFLMGVNSVGLLLGLGGAFPVFAIASILSSAIFTIAWLRIRGKKKNARVEDNQALFSRKKGVLGLVISLFAISNALSGGFLLGGVAVGLTLPFSINIIWAVLALSFIAGVLGAINSINTIDQSYVDKVYGTKKWKLGFKITALTLVVSLFGLALLLGLLFLSTPASIFAILGLLGAFYTLIHW